MTGASWRNIRKQGQILCLTGVRKDSWNRILRDRQRYRVSEDRDRENEILTVNALHQSTEIVLKQCSFTECVDDVHESKSILRLYP